MGKATAEITFDPRPPVVTPDSEKIIHTPVRPPAKRKKQRKERSDKGKKRTTEKPVQETKPEINSEYKELGLSKEAARLKKLYKPFDEYRKSDNWLVQVWPCWNNFDRYELRFAFNGIRYGYRQTFTDASLAVTIGTQYLDHRYKNKTLYGENSVK